MIQKLIRQLVTKPGHSDSSYSFELLWIIQFESKTKSIQKLAINKINRTKQRNLQNSQTKTKTWSLKPSGSVDKLTQCTLFINWLSRPMNLLFFLYPLFLVSVTPEAQCPEIAAPASSSLIYLQAESLGIHIDLLIQPSLPLTSFPTVHCFLWSYTDIIQVFTIAFVSYWLLTCLLTFKPHFYIS